MGIRSELAVELKSLLASDVVKGKIAIRRAYADWRRYPQYVLPLTETSIDLIYAPAYGSARKNATDIRLAIDAMELVFTRPEIGTIVLLSGDSDFSSLVIKLKEYGKYVIGVGIRESSSDLLVQNCDEYYSYNALAGLVRAGEEPVTKWDPWELVSEAVARMKRNGDVMRADRLKQVMQEIDNSFDEKDLSMSKFSRFVTEAAQRGLLHVTKLENGQLEVDLPRSPVEAPPAAAPAPPVAAAPESAPRARAQRRESPRETPVPRAPAPAQTPTPTPTPTPIPSPAPTGERLTRTESFDLLKRAVDELTATGKRVIPASALREKARELLGRDSETLSERYFARILQDAHDADVIDVRRRGDDYEVVKAEPTPSLAEQLGMGSPSQAGATAEAGRPAAAGAPPARMSRAGRAAFGKKLGELPPDLLSIGVVEVSPPGGPVVADKPAADAADAGRPPERKRPARKTQRARGARRKEEDASGSESDGGDEQKKSGARGRRGRKTGKTDSGTPEPSTATA
jgi:uncharacterized protein (TIGR00288 family)